MYTDFKFPAINVLNWWLVLVRGKAVVVQIVIVKDVVVVCGTLHCSNKNNLRESYVLSDLLTYFDFKMCEDTFWGWSLLKAVTVVDNVSFVIDGTYEIKRI